MHVIILLTIQGVMRMALLDTKTQNNFVNYKRLS